MTNSRAVEHFAEELSLLYHRFVQEYEMSYAEAVGCIEMFKLDVMENCIIDDSEDEEGDEL